MELLTLLAEADAAGFTFRVDGDRLVVRGPKSAALIARWLGEHKAAVLEQLRRDLAEEREERIAIMTIDGGVPLEDAVRFVNERELGKLIQF